MSVNTCTSLDCNWHNLSNSLAIVCTFVSRGLYFSLQSIVLVLVMFRDGPEGKKLEFLCVYADCVPHLGCY